jgi:TRAP-type C4-dicarboxylate transport system substrate-binding protein
MRIKTLGFAMLAAALATGATGTLAQKWDMPTPYAPTSFHTENIKQFVAEVEKASGDKLKINIHAGGSLLPGAQIKRAVQAGQVPIGEILISNLANEDAIFGIDTVPFVATSYPEARKLWEASRKVTTERLAKQGIVLLYSVPWPPQELFTNKPINNIADLKGLKFRAYNVATSRLAELAGMQPVKIELADLPQAMVTGGIQAYITSSSGGCDSKAWETSKFVYDTQGWVPKNVVLVNQKAFSSLDKRVQDAMRKAAVTAEARGWKMSEEGNKQCLEMLASRGMQVVKPSAQLMGELKKFGNTMAAEWLKDAGPDGKAALDAFRK